MPGGTSPPRTSASNWYRRLVRRLRGLLSGERRGVRREQVPRSEPGSQDPAASWLLHGRADASPYAEPWRALVLEPLDCHGLARHLGLSADLGFDALLRVLLPSLGDRPLSSDRPAAPPSLLFAPKGCEPVPVRFPVDWTLDPYRDRDFRLWFQSLSWLDHVYDATGRGLDDGAALVTDWAERVLPRRQPAELTWDQHAVAARIDRVARFTLSYARHATEPSREVLRACARILLSHMYALALAPLYLPRHNHGLMQDRSLLMHAKLLPALLDAPAFIDLAERRLQREQLERSTTADHVHVENSPHYHLLFVRLLAQLVEEAYSNFGHSAPDWLVGKRNALLDSLLHFVQPNRTLPQFGDTLNVDIGRDLREIRDRSRRSVGLPRALHRRLEFVISAGERGDAPEQTDRVFVHGGYACLRSGWRAPWTSATTLHIKVGRLSSVHLHRDDTTFELCGFGQELVVDVGRYSNDRSKPRAQQAVASASHNVVLVNDQELKRSASPAAIVAHGTNGEVSFVCCRHGYFADEGVHAYERWFVYFKTLSSLVVLDQLDVSRPCRVTRHLYLHPDLMPATQPRESHRLSFVRPDGCGLSAEALEPHGSLKAVLGAADGTGPQYYARENEGTPCIDVVRSGPLAAGRHRWALGLSLTEPSAEATRLRFVPTGAARWELRAVRGEELHTFVFPDTAATCS